MARPFEKIWISKRGPAAADAEQVFPPYGSGEEKRKNARDREGDGDAVRDLHRMKVYEGSRDQRGDRDPRD
jgi:hypothetical protein